MFSKKATKFDTVDLTIYAVNVKSTVKISSIFVAFLENMNFNEDVESILHYPRKFRILYEKIK